VKDTESNPASALFKTAWKLNVQKKQLAKLGYHCDPCDPFLPLRQPSAFYGEKNQQFIAIVEKIIDFTQESDQDLIFLKGPRGSGKTIFAQIFAHIFEEQLEVSATYQDASGLFNETPFQTKDAISFTSDNDSEDIIFLDRAFHLHKTLNRLQSLNPSSSRPGSPKIIAILDSTEFEIYRRTCIQLGENSYQNFLLMPQLKTDEITKLLQRRLKACYGNQTIFNGFKTMIENISFFALGNPGVAIRLLDETLKFSLNIEDLSHTFGINPIALSDFPKSKLPILREILIREIRNQFLPVKHQTFIIHKELTTLMNKTKSTISHHLGDLMSQNLIYEQSTDRDKREKAYRPNNTIFGILEHLAFETSYYDNTQISIEGINREE
jgi:DNA-binding transcriptional ArsR family regulator